MINEELTAEEWKRRYEKERDKNSKLKFALERCQSELARWRTGEKIFISINICYVFYLNKFRYVFEFKRFLNVIFKPLFLC